MCDEQSRRDLEQRVQALPKLQRERLARTIHAVEERLTCPPGRNPTDPLYVEMSDELADLTCCAYERYQRRVARLLE